MAGCFVMRLGNHEAVEPRPLASADNGIRLTPLSAFVLYVGLVFQHFQIIAAFKYPVTLGAACAYILLVALVRPFPWARLAPVLAVQAALTVLAAWWDPRHTDPLQLLRTGALLVVATTFVICGLSPLAARGRGTLMGTVLFRALLTIVGMAVAQVAVGIAGSDALFNPFRSFQYLYQYEPWIGYGIPRAQSFFLEPSYAALVITFLGSSLVALNYRRALSLTATVAGTVACQSATGLIVLVITLIILAATGRQSNGLGALLTATVVLVTSGGYLISRIGSASDADSSAYYRMVAPLQVLRSTLIEAPLGRPLGSVATFTSQANLQNGSVSGVTIDNGYFLLVFYFGWVGVIGIAAGLTAVCLVATHTTTKSGVWPLLLWILFCPVFNGGIFLPEFAMMIWLSITLSVTLYSQRRISSNDDSSVDCNGYPE